MKSLVERIPTLPGPVRSVLRNAVWTFGIATARLRPLPDFLILGAQKAGTTALYAYLRRHPGITGPRWKEVSYFDRHYRRGRAWYRGNFPVRLSSGRIFGEASPSYLFHPLAPERAAALVPDARLIAILRNPVERAYSHYQHEVSFGREQLSFEDALEQEDARMAGELERMRADPGYFSESWWSYTYVARGLYAEQLERWQAAFPAGQLLVLTNEELSAQPAATYARVLEFLGAEPYELDAYPRIFDRDYPDLSVETRERLAARFAAPNRRLYELLGRDLGWDAT
ncbi:MAG TPA: sulfotransferase [Gaiellaceae bacterium]|nr:sulfotransferase [Gaiellaceae bacterium]